jgi:hypothetical protein
VGAAQKSGSYDFDYWRMAGSGCLWAEPFSNIEQAMVGADAARCYRSALPPDSCLGRNQGNHEDGRCSVMAEIVFLKSRAQRGIYILLKNAIGDIQDEEQAKIGALKTFVAIWIPRFASEFQIKVL